MKKLYTIISLLFVSAAAMAQVNVTYRVDVTNYIVGTPLGPGGMRVGGNFATVGNNNSILDWSPSDAASAMTDLGGNIWSITVNYPASAVGTTQLFKFVNDNWGTNEGTDPGNTIATGGCGVDDGAGNINRTVTVPATDLALEYCFDQCLQCDGSSPVVTSVKSISNAKFGLNNAPNPVRNNTIFSYSLNRTAAVALTVVDALGKEVATLVNGVQSAGAQNIKWTPASLSNGVYFYTLTIDGEKVSRKLIINR
jgi:Secretion system C-terminal sorting domain